MNQDYVYNAICIRVIDGDTIDCNVDLGFCVYVVHRFRLLDIDTPELNSKDALEREKAAQARDFVAKMIHGRRIVIQSEKSDSFGRWLCKVFIDGHCLNDLLLTEGHAAPYKK